MFKPVSEVRRTLSSAVQYLGAPIRSTGFAFFVIVVLLAQGFASTLTAAPTHADTLNPIQIENQQPGDPTWDDFASVAQQDAISGYASPISVNHGQSVDFYVTTTASSFTMKVYRMGWYGGAGARLMTTIGPLTGVHQAVPSPDPVTGMVSCDGKWQKTTTLNVPSTWVTGVYLVKLVASNGDDSFIYFVVRNDGGTEPIEFQTSVTTYQAYNAWGGVSLYDNQTNGSVYKYAHATKVSFDRPFNPLDDNGAGNFTDYEYPFIRWAESQGYNLTYITGVDTHTNVNPLTNHKVFLSVGHDEYWSRGMRTNVENAINAGVNVAFFSANTMYWQIRFEPNADGVANRVQVGYKDFSELTGPPGPDLEWGVNNSIVTDYWRSPVVNQPENAVIGVMYQDQVQKSYPYVVQNSSNWIYAGTGFTDGSSIPGIVGYEYDKVWNNGYTPAGETVLSNSPVLGCCEGSGNSDSNSTLYTAASGAQVFAAGTIQWSWGLDNYGSGTNYVNAGIQRTTANILANFTSGGTAAVPAVTLSPTSLAFGNQQTNATSAAKTVTLTNSGTAALTISSIGLTGSNTGDFAQTNTCPISPSTLAAGANCSISVTFAPSATGSRSASVSISDNAGGSPQGLALSGTGTAPAVTLSPTSLSFSSQPTGTTSAGQPVTLTNSGTAPLTISSVGMTGSNATDFGQTNTCPLGPSTLAVNGTCTITVTFSPTATGTRTASVSIADNAGGSPQSIALSGTGTTPAPVVSLNPTSLAFGTQQTGTTSAAQTITVTNSGNADLTISSIGLSGGNTGDFGQTNTCPLSPSTLAANSSCTISVTFSPAATGSRSASVSIADNAAGSPQTVAVSGTGTGPAVSLNPTSLTFASQTVNTTSAAQSVTLTNSGNAPLTISSIGITGTNTGDFAQTTTCPVSPSTLAVNGTCTIGVTFTPSATGSRSASVSITDNAADSPESVALSGTGIAPAPAVTLNPTSLAFGNQQTGTTSAAQSVTVTNSGTAALTISSIALAGTNAGDFGQTTTCPLSPSTLAVNSSCTISVTFSPTATGSRTASVSISDDAANNPQSVALSGTGTSPAVSLSPTSLAFGNQTTNTTSPAQSVTVTNSGTAPLTISSIGITGTNTGDFGQTTTCPLSPSTLAVNGTCTISVTFTPTTTGSRTASVTITDNAADSPESVALSGTGIAPAPAVTLNPTSLAFGNQVINTTSAAKTVTLTNSGTAALSISSIGMSGTNATDFAQTNTCPISPSTLAAGANCNISVTFTPSATGSRSAGVSITDNAGGSPQTVALSGTGTTPPPAVSLIGSTTATGNFGAGVALKVPTTAAARDLLIAVAGTNGTPSSWTAPTGWTAGANSAHPSGQGLNWWWKVATASDAGASAIFKAKSFARGAGEVLDYRGLSASSPIVAVSTMATNSNGGAGNVTTPIFKSVSWSGSTSVVSLLLMSWQPNPATVTWPAGFGLQATANDGFDSVAAGANLTPQTTTSLATQTATLSKASDIIPTLQVALRVGP
jgi:Abnormal spindle-like microcephaly-assoc'd, ASPM-SPD-2-Hydin